jgi:hypothetical protein
LGDLPAFRIATKRRALPRRRLINVETFGDVLERTALDDDLSGGLILELCRGVPSAHRWNSFG